MKIKTVASALMAFSMLVTAVAVSASGSERGEYGERGERSEYGSSSRGGSSVEPVTNQQYKDECGSCHFAYQPGLLPERSWRKLMSSLNDHFGENAELPDADRQALTDYLASHAGDHSDARRAQQLVRSIAAGDAPLRISQVPFFQREHREIPRRVIESKEVGSLSNCQVCHRTADRGDFEERNINIPGYGRWED